MVQIIDGKVNIATLNNDYTTLANLKINGKAIEEIPEDVSNNLYIFDTRASTLKNILMANKIDISKPIDIKDLQELKEKDLINKIINLSSN